MSYLVQYALRRPPQQAVGQNRVDEKSLLNLPGFHGEAHVRVLVSDTTRQRWKREPPQPKIKLRDHRLLARDLPAVRGGLR